MVRAAALTLATVVLCLYFAVWIPEHLPDTGDRQTCVIDLVLSDKPGSEVTEVTPRTIGIERTP